MAELFEAIGFDVVDEESYNLIAEYAETSGQRSFIHRGDATLHGRCWKLGEGVEVWSIVYDAATQLYYADCRPAFRSRYVRSIHPWELVEYDEDGEAIVRGRLSDGAELVFELQNLTEVNQSAFREPKLQVAVAGLAYSAEMDSGGGGDTDGRAPRFYLVDSVPDLTRDSCENDYVIRGTVLSWREMQNRVTSKGLVWFHLDAGAIRVEVLVSSRVLKGEPAIGATLNARIWLQGYVLTGSDLTARYEGVDPESEPSDFWSALRRGN